MTNISSPRSRLAILFFALALMGACSDDGSDSNTTRDATADPGDARTEPPQGYCNDVNDCGAGSRCTFGYCVRAAPEESSAQCNSVFHEPPGDACAINPVTGEVTTLATPECEDNGDCLESPYGPNCMYGACTVLEPCDENGECPEAEQYCHDYNVCISSSVE